VRFARPRSLRRPLRVLAALSLLAAVEPTAAIADTFQRDTTPLPSSLTGAAKKSASDGPSSGSGFMRLAIGLVVVLALIFAIRWVVRRAGSAKLPTGNGKLSVVATTPLGPNRAVHLIRIGSELVLVGSSEQGVRSLRVYNAAEAAELSAQLDPNAAQFPPLAPAGGPGWTGFVDELRKRTARK